MLEGDRSLVRYQRPVAQDEEDDKREPAHHVEIANRKDREEQRIAILQVEEWREAMRHLIRHVEKIEDELGQQEGQQEPVASLAAAPRQQEPARQKPDECGRQQRCAEERRQRPVRQIVEVEIVTTPQP
jgi:hypothetical protein